MTTRESSRRGGFLTTVTLTPAEAETLALGAADSAAEAIDFARDYVGEFTASVIAEDEEPKWYKLADAITSLRSGLEQLEAVQRLGGYGPDATNVVQLAVVGPDDEAS